MSANALLSTVILVSFIVTIVLAVGSYMAYKYRERRQPKAALSQSGDDPVFFERFFPQKPIASAQNSVASGSVEDESGARTG
jgi:heme/copper-type cytochrome/quinol oxidase subunit 2